MVPYFCQLSFFSLAIGSPGNDDLTASESFQSRLPSPTSLKLVEHLGQLYDSGRFQDYDYGAQANIARYGSETPPEFDLTQITDIPIAILEAKLDFEAAEQDNEWLMQQIGDIVVFNRTYDHYGHYDLYIAKNTTVYLEDVVNLLQQYNQG